MPEEKTLVWTDPATDKKYKIKYHGNPPSDAAIRKMAGVGPVKTHEYRHPDDGKTYKVKYRGNAPPSGARIIEAAKPVRNDNVNKPFVRPAPSNGGGWFGGSANLAPLEVDPKTGAVREPSDLRNKSNDPRVINYNGTTNGVPVNGNPDSFLRIISPVAAPIGRAISKVSNAPRNMAQGMTAPGLDRFDSMVAAGQNPTAATMTKALFTDIPGNIKAGARAVVRDDGDKEIGKRVPELAIEEDDHSKFIFRPFQSNSVDSVTFERFYLHDLIKQFLHIVSTQPV